MPILFTLHQIADDYLDNEQFGQEEANYSEERIKRWEFKASFFFGISLGSTNISLLV